MGKFLSPRLFLSYGVALFDPGQVITLRYHISPNWNLEAQSATSFNRAAVNYRYGVYKVFLLHGNHVS